MNRYSISLAWSDEDQGYIAVSSEFPGVSAFGETEQAALEELKVALKAAIEVCQEEGLPVPEPRVRQLHSGQFRLRMPKNLHARLAERADQEGVSQNTLVVTYISSCVSGASAVDAFASRLEPVVGEARTAVGQLSKIAGDLAGHRRETWEYRELNQWVRSAWSTRCIVDQMRARALPELLEFGPAHEGHSGRRKSS